MLLLIDCLLLLPLMHLLSLDFKRIFRRLFESLVLTQLGLHRFHLSSGSVQLYLHFLHLHRMLLLSSGLLC
jgi:hypothetical protein